MIIYKNAWSGKFERNVLYLCSFNRFKKIIKPLYYRTTDLLVTWERKKNNKYLCVTNDINET